MRGTLRKSREPGEPAIPRPGKAQPPPWLPLAERAAFRQLEAETARTGTPTRSFAHILTGAAIAWAQLERCTKTLAEKGDVFETTTTTGALKLAMRPEVQIRDTSLRLLRGYLAVLGLSPVDIGRVDRAALPAEEADDFEKRFLRRERYFKR